MDRALFREISRMIEPLKRKAKLAINRAVVRLANDATGLQSVQATMFEGEASEIEHMQPGGVTHVPIAGAEGLFLTVSGSRDDGVVICVSERSGRPRGLISGETALYSTGALPNQIVIKADGTIEAGVGAVDLVALSTLVAANMTTLKSAITAAKVAATEGDGGLAAFSSLEAALSAWPASMAATQLTAF